MGKHPGGSDERLGWATLAAAVILSGCASGTGASLPPRTEGRLRVAGLNVHYLAPRGGAVTQWPPREAAVVATLSAIDADVIAFQEMETFAGGAFNRDNLQQESLAAAFPAFGFTATGDPEVFPNTQPIMFRRARFTPREQGYVFFSPTSSSTCTSIARATAINFAPRNWWRKSSPKFDGPMIGSSSWAISTPFGGWRRYGSSPGTRDSRYCGATGRRSISIVASIWFPPSTTSSSGRRSTPPIPGR